MNAKRVCQGCLISYPSSFFCRSSSTEKINFGDGDYENSPKQRDFCKRCVDLYNSQEEWHKSLKKEGLDQEAEEYRKRIILVRKAMKGNISEEESKEKILKEETSLEENPEEELKVVDDRFIEFSQNIIVKLEKLESKLSKLDEKTSESLELNQKIYTSIEGEDEDEDEDSENYIELSPSYNKLFLSIKSFVSENIVYTGDSDDVILCEKFHSSIFKFLDSKNLQYDKNLIQLYLKMMNKLFSYVKEDFGKKYYIEVKLSEDKSSYLT